jgi:hypothetical protein
VTQLDRFSDGVETPGNIVWDLLTRPEGRVNSPMQRGQSPDLQVREWKKENPLPKGFSPTSISGQPYQLSCVTVIKDIHKN